MVILEVAANSKPFNSTPLQQQTASLCRNQHFRYTYSAQLLCTFVGFHIVRFPLRTVSRFRFTFSRVESLVADILGGGVVGWGGGGCLKAYPDFDCYASMKIFYSLDGRKTFF